MLWARETQATIVRLKAQSCGKGTTRILSLARRVEEDLLANRPVGSHHTAFLHGSQPYGCKIPKPEIALGIQACKQYLLWALKYVYTLPTLGCLYPRVWYEPSGRDQKQLGRAFSNCYPLAWRLGVTLFWLGVT